MLLSGNIDNDTVAAFELNKNFDDVLISYTDVSKVMMKQNSFILQFIISQILNYQMQGNIHVQVALMML